MIARLVRRCCLTLWLIPAGNAVIADQAQDLDRLVDLLRFEETIGIMHDEGLRYGGELADGMLPDADRQSWIATVSRIYDEDKMLALISTDFRDELADANLAPLLDYFDSEDGREIVAMELSARQVFLDPEAEEAAIAQYQAERDEDTALIGLVDQVITDSDLVEFNVMGTLNSSLMFYRGLSEGGAYDLSESEILSDVWSQEEATRRNSEEWLGAFLLLAYQPLDTAKLEAYAAFFRTPEGRELNRAIFAAFDGMYEELSYLMGLAVAEHLTSEPL